jgi:hypothetical protein
VSRSDAVNGIRNVNATCCLLSSGNLGLSSILHRQESSVGVWIPACAGMTDYPLL